MPASIAGARAQVRTREHTHTRIARMFARGQFDCSRCKRSAFSSYADSCSSPLPLFHAVDATAAPTPGLKLHDCASKELIRAPIVKDRVKRQLWVKLLADSHQRHEPMLSASDVGAKISKYVKSTPRNADARRACGGGEVPAGVLTPLSSAEIQLTVRR